MVDYTKQDMSLIWGELGDRVAPTNAKITTGWAVEVPPRQYWNWIEHRQDAMLAYLAQKGIVEWDVASEYLINKSYVQHNGVVYKCVRTNTGVTPGTSTLDWVVAFTTSTTASEALKSVAVAADKIPYFNGASTATTTTLTAFARTILDDVDAVGVRTTISAQQLNTNLTSISSLTSAANKLPYFTGATTAATTDLSAFGRSLIDDADAAGARTTLGLGSVATQNSNAVAITGGSITGITDLAIADGGTGASDAAGARTNLGLGTAAVSNITASITDTTAGRVLKVGDFGIGGIGNTIPDAADLNNYTTPGLYGQTSNTSAANGVNYPVPAAGTLLVESAGGSITTQTYKEYSSGQLYTRGRYTTTWYPWRKSFDTENVSTFIQSLLDDADAATARATLGANNATNLTTGTLPDARLSGTYTGASIGGNAATATTLQTARTINGVSFNGSANITVADSTKVPLTGGTMTGTLSGPTFNATSTTGGGFQGIDADGVTIPSFTWTADLDTGIYHPAADVIGFTAGGAERGRVNVTGFSGNGSQLTALNAANVSTGTLAVARGGTGVTTSTGSGNNVLSASPSLTGTPTAPTAAAGTNSTQIATTAFVQNSLSGTSSAGMSTAWVNFNGTGTVAIRGNYNVSSITDNGVGLYTVNFAAAMSSANYAAVANYSYQNSATYSGNDGQASCHTYAVGSVRVVTPSGGANGIDPQIVSVAIFGGK